MRLLREAYPAEVAPVAAERLLVVDESGCTTSMTRTRGRAPRGERVHDAVPGGRWATTTPIGAVRCDGVAAVSTPEAATDRPRFLCFVRKALAPAPRPGDGVVMDNLSAHKVAGVRAAVEAAGARLPYLPPYSPDLLPIERCWSKVKQALRSAAARTAEALGRAVEAAFTAVTTRDLRNWFRHCGYRPA